MDNRFPHEKLPNDVLRVKALQMLPEQAKTKGFATGKDGHRVGVYGSSAENVGVWGETNSDKVAAMAAYQMNKDSDQPAFFARHAGYRKAARFEGNVEVTGELSIQGVNIFGLIHYVRELERQVDMLSSQFQQHTRNHSGSGTPPQGFQISVTINDGNVILTGQGFRPAVTCFVFVTYPDFTYKKFDSTPDSYGKLNFTIPVTALCIPGLPLSLRFTVNQPDAAGHDKFPNAVTETIGC